jgi:tRNA-2-methylthio-N6-dimethylallyladenosine synthase
MPKTYFIKTFGCQMNVSDSERISGFLEKNGFKPASNIDEADLAVFNTCGVRQMAENRVYGQIHNLKKQVTRNKIQTKIILTGCLANRKDVQRRLKDKVDLFCEIKDFPEKILNFEFRISNQALISNALILKQTIKSTFNNSDLNQNSKFKIQNLGASESSCSYLSIKPNYGNNYSANIPIMSGCNNFCSYCVVPYARGRETSRPAEKILDEIRGLVKNGYKSITLLGQNVNSYKSENIKLKNYNFSKLLKEINKIPGKFWIYFVSSHPKDMSDELIETIAKCKKVCEMIHLPVQSGSDEILEKMNRKYTAKHYLGLVRKIKSAFKKHKPGIPFSLTSDIIVGFPGETRKQFLESAEIMEKVRYDMVFFGQYSPRPGTAAWKFKDDVSNAEKARREKYLNTILAGTALANNRKYLQKTVEVLIENQKNGSCFGKTRTLKNVKIATDRKKLVGNFVSTKITKTTAWHLEGELL